MGKFKEHCLPEGSPEALRIRDVEEMGVRSKSGEVSEIVKRGSVKYRRLK